MPKAEYPAFAALNPFFDVVQKGLQGFVDGQHYFDTVAEDAHFADCERRFHAMVSAHFI